MLVAMTDMRVMTIKGMESRFLEGFERDLAEAGTGGFKSLGGMVGSGVSGIEGDCLDMSSTTGSVSGVTPLNSSGITFNYIDSWR